MFVKDTTKMIKHLQLLFILSFCNFTSFSEVIPKTYEAKSTTSEIKVDGKADESTWESATIAGDFAQLEPVEGTPVTQRTEVKLMYDNTAIYIFAKMYDTNPDSILHELGNRDEGGSLNADGFKFGFDPYNKRQNGYVFEVSASGVQTEYFDDDLTFDAVWQSAVSFDPDGWSVEMKIPYSAIRFPASNIQTWAVQFARSIRRNREYDQWTLTPKEIQNKILYWGTMTGIHDIKPPVRLTLTPYFSVYSDRAPRFENGEKVGYDNSFGYAGGADLKYGIDERFTLDMTLLPDFSQVQSDNKVKNLSAFETIYDENRPFFKEGTALFSKGNLFYSRRIGETPSLFYSAPYLLNDGEVLEKNPDKAKLLNATKLSGRTDKGLGIGILNAITGNTYATIKKPDGTTRKLLTEPLTNFNIFVLDQQLKHNSSIYIINSNVTREGKARDANATAVQASFQDKNNSYQLRGGGTLTRVSEWDDSQKNIKNGHLGFFAADKIKGKSQYGISFEVADSNFDKNDLSYNFYKDYTSLNAYWSILAFNPFWKYFKQGNITPYINRSGRLSDSNKQTDFSAGFSFFLLFNNNWSANCDFGGALADGLDFYEPRLSGRYSRTPGNHYGSFNFTTNYNKALAFDFGGRFNIIHEWNYSNRGYYISPIIRVSDKMSIKIEHYLDVYNNDRGFVDYNIDSNSIYYGGRDIITITNSITSRYLFKNDMSLSLTGRHYWSEGTYKNYYQLLANGELVPSSTDDITKFNFNSNYFTIDLVYNWQFAPGSSFLVTFKNIILADDNQTHHDYFRNLNRTLSSPQTNSVSLKFLYYLDYQYFVKKKV